MTLLNNGNDQADNNKKFYLEASQGHSPSFAQAAANSFVSTSIKGARGIAGLLEHSRHQAKKAEPAMFKKMFRPSELATKNIDNAMKQFAYDPMNTKLGQIQKRADDINAMGDSFGAKAGSFVGAAIPFMVAGAPGEAVGKLAAQGVRRGIMAAGPKLGAESTAARLTSPAASQITSNTLRGGAGMASAMLPEDIVNNMKDDQDGVNWGGVIQDMGSNLGIGMGLGAASYPLGQIWKKIRGRVKDDAKPLDPDTDEAARESEKTASWEPELKEFWDAYKKGDSTENLNEIAQRYIKKNAPDILNDQGNIDIPVLNKQEAQSFNHGYAVEATNESAGHHPNAITNMIHQKAMNRLAWDTPKSDAIDGARFHLRHTLDPKRRANFRERQLKQLRQRMADIRQGEKSDAKSQKALFDEYMEDFGDEENLIHRAQQKERGRRPGEGRGPNGHIPEKLKRKLHIQGNINRAKKQLEHLEKTNPEGAAEKIKDIKNKEIPELEKKRDNIELPDLDTELNDIQSTLFNQDHHHFDVHPDWAEHESYKRLGQLSDTKTPHAKANTLLHNAAHDGESAKMDAHKEVLDALKKRMDESKGSDVPYNQPMDYMKSLLDRRFSHSAEQDKEQAQQIQSQVDQLKKELNDADIDNVEPNWQAAAWQRDDAETDAIKDNVQSAVRRARKMKTSDEAFDKLEQCLTGKFNG